MGEAILSLDMQKTFLMFSYICILPSMQSVCGIEF